MRPPAQPRSSGARLVVLVPLLWLACFFLLPALIVLKISLSQPAVAQPPYAPTLDLAAGWAGLKEFLAGLSFDNYVLLATDPLYVGSYLKSLKVAALSTLALLAVGYPLAYAMARAPRRLQGFLLLLVILPFWTAFLIRIYAWMTILQRDGLLNQALLALGIIDTPVTWLASDTAVYIGIVYSYLPFIVLPIYASLERIDPTLLEAAADLGCTPTQAFWRVTVPLSLPGVMAGATICFIPIVGEFVVPDLLGSSATMMIGQTLWAEFFANRDWPLAAAVAIVMLVLLIAPLVLYEHLQARFMASER
ncbi:MAG: ABC transporter permease subunit [Variibacter sp.]|nr:ABC transporter permease subunit [Variibacter sp.]